MAPFPYFGGKGRMLDFIHEHLPDAHGFIDLFGGSGAVSLSVVGKYKHIIYNDINSRLYGFFKVLREDFDRLAEVLEFTPFSREELENAYERASDPVEDARRVFVCVNQSFANKGLWGRTGWSTPSINAGKRADRFQARKDALRHIARMMCAMDIENRDWREVVGRAKSNSIVFADPPYDLNARTGKAYANEMTDEDHFDLSKMLESSPGAAVVCGYASPLYARLYRQWRMESREVVNGTFTRTECLWIKEASR